MYNWEGVWACGLKGLNAWPYMTSKGGTMMRGNIGTHRSKGFNGWPIVTCDNGIVTAKRRGSKDLNVWPIVTCDDGIVTAWVRRLKGFDMWLIVLWSWVSPDSLSSYDWLTSTATTSHVTNSWDAFTTYHTINLTAVTGIGSIKAQAQGRGSVKLKSIVNENIYILKLEDVLYIPTNQHNLISLGHWDKAGGQYMGGGSVILSWKMENMLQWEIKSIIICIKCRWQLTITKINLLRL